MLALSNVSCQLTHDGDGDEALVPKVLEAEEEVGVEEACEDTYIRTYIRRDRIKSQESSVKH